MGFLERLKKAVRIRPDWSSAPFPGNATQFKGCSDEWNEQALVIGFDFGTAYTKAVIGESRTHYLVPMSGSIKAKEYLTRSGFYLQRDGAASLSQMGPDAQFITDLKMPLLMGSANEEDLVRIATYIALCLRRIRHWLLTEHRKTYGGQRIDWAFNIGIPTDSFENDRLNKAYWRCCNVAWAVSLIPGPINISQARRILSSGQDFTEALDALVVPQEEMLHPEMISLFPEFLAQIAGYVRSPRRQSDLHMLVDVGAGTLDATVFNVHEIGGEDIFPRFARSVTKLGAHFLIKHRLATSKNTNPGFLADFDPLPATPEFAARLGVSHSELQAHDAQFRRLVYGTIGDQLRVTKTKMYKKSPRWKTGVPVFLTGGGANIDFYQDVLRKFQHEDQLKIALDTLPKPSNLSAPGLEEHEFGRISVAYGLSFDPDDLGESKPSEPDNTVSKPQARRSWEENYVDASMV